MARPASTAPRFEIVLERDMPKRRYRRSSLPVVGAFFTALRTVIEDAYVALAQEAMVRSEHLEDMRAERSYRKRLHRAERRRLRQAEHPLVPASSVSAGSQPGS